MGGVKDLVPRRRGARRKPLPGAQWVAAAAGRQRPRLARLPRHRPVAGGWPGEGNSAKVCTPT